MQDKNFWKKYFTVYDCLNHLIPYQELLEEVVNGLDISEGDKILDAGCGTGNLVKKLSDEDVDVLCVDSSEEALEICEEKRIKNVRTLCLDIVNPLSFKDGEFDRIILSNVLYTIPSKHHDDVIKELYRVLKSGGELVMVNPKEGWSAVSIYKEGLMKSIGKHGLLKTIKLGFKLLIPTTKIFYYNFMLKKESKNYFFNKGEQEKLLKKHGFSKIKISKPVYANQSYLVIAVK